MSSVIASGQPVRVVVWGENVHEQEQQEVRDLYPRGMHGAIKEGIEENLGRRAVVRTATLQDPEHGLTEDVLRETDVLVWWGHAAHDQVADDVVDRIQRHVLAGMGLLVLHSGHWSKIFGRLMGTTCTLRWRSKDDREIVWTVDPTHPIARGVPHPFIIPA
ncbi:MAG TPA: ThuA domain-containing protein, partial [Candidatus Microbacterium pullistercoris]|nr:ThuA domain-containing protein [Candidatus Microbacterium pullistercoris]